MRLLKNIFSYIKTSDKYFLIFLLLFTGSGCSMHAPEITPSGEVVGGDEKLRSILIIIKEKRDKWARKNMGVIDGYYTAIIDPSGDLVKSGHLLRGTNQTVGVIYQFIYNPKTLSNARIASVTESLVYKKDGSVHVDCSTHVYRWRDGQWNILRSQEWGILGGYEKMRQLYEQRKKNGEHATTQNEL